MKTICARSAAALGLIETGTRKQIRTTLPVRLLGLLAAEPLVVDFLDP